MICQTPKILKQIKNLEKKHKANITKNLLITGEEAKTALVDMITTGERSGRTYLYKGVRLTASAGGEPPASRSGTLANSFDYEVDSKELIVFSNAFNGEAPYPYFLEEGTVKMEARPFFKVVNEAKGEILARLLGGVRE